MTTYVRRRPLVYISSIKHTHSILSKHIFTHRRNKTESPLQGCITQYSVTVEGYIPGNFLLIPNRRYQKLGYQKLVQQFIAETQGVIIKITAETKRPPFKCVSSEAISERTSLSTLHFNKIKLVTYSLAFAPA